MKRRRCFFIHGRNNVPARTRNNNHRTTYFFYAIRWIANKTPYAEIRLDGHFDPFFRSTKSSFIGRKIPYYGGSGIVNNLVELLTIEERMENDKYKWNFGRCPAQAGVQQANHKVR
jgi:hypothetical protein